MNLWMDIFYIFHKQEFIFLILQKKKKVFLLLYILAGIFNVWSISKSSEK